jgi:hypothetical protein
MFLSLSFHFNAVYRDNAIGTNDRTVVTTGAFLRVFHVGKMIAFSVHFSFHPEYAGRTCLYAEFTAFATFNINDDSTSLLSHIRYILNA